MGMSRPCAIRRPSASGRADERSPASLSSGDRAERMTITLISSAIAYSALRTTSRVTGWIRVKTRSPASRADSLHHETAVHAERLAGHVACVWRGEEGDHVRDVLGTLHPPEGHRCRALAGELLGGEASHRSQLARDFRPHVGLHEAGTDAVHADPVGGVGGGRPPGKVDHAGYA